MSRATRDAATTADPFASRRRWVPLGLGLILVAVAALSLSLGAVSVDVDEVARVLLHRLGIGGGDEPAFSIDAVIWNIRLPRVVMGCVVGGALALTGGALQGVFRNQLADPQLLGIGPGAALGAAIGARLSGTEVAILAGIVAGIITALVVRALGRATDVEPSRFILMGVALGAALTAWVGFVVFSTNATRVPPIEFWLLGSLTGSTWRIVGITTIFVVLGAIALVGSSRNLDLLSLGEAEARHLGVNVEVVTTLLMITIGAIVGATVGAVGVIAFVGLLVPHLVRRLTGPLHRNLLVSSILGGAIFLVAADLVARTVASPREIPVGLVTAAVGGPVFIYLIYRSRDV